MIFVQRGQLIKYLIIYTMQFNLVQLQTKLIVGKGTKEPSGVPQHNGRHCHTAPFLKVLPNEQPRPRPLPPAEAEAYRRTGVSSSVSAGGAAQVWLPPVGVQKQASWSSSTRARGAQAWWPAGSQTRLAAAAALLQRGLAAERSSRTQADRTRLRARLLYPAEASCRHSPTFQTDWDTYPLATAF